MSTTIRVSEPTRDRFAKLAQETGRPMSQLLDEAADALERRVFFDQLSAGYESLRADPHAQYCRLAIDRQAAGANPVLGLAARTQSKRRQHLLQALGGSGGRHMIAQFESSGGAASSPEVFGGDAE